MAFILLNNLKSIRNNIDMSVKVNLYSEKTNEIKKFLDVFYELDISVSDYLKWEKVFPNPTEMADIISVFIDNNDKFKITMCVSFDEDFFINVTDYNSDKIIRYLFERYPY